MKKLVTILLVIALATTIFAGCQSQNDPTPAQPSDAPSVNTPAGDNTPSGETPSEGLKEPIYFAWIGPLSGDSTLDGITEKASLEICLEHINSNGGVMGHELVIDFFDDKNDTTEAVNIANMVVDAGKYIAAVGSWSSTPSMAMAPVFEEAKIIQYSPTASHADFSGLGDYMFRNTPTQLLETTAYADYLAEQGIETVALLYQNDDWGLNVNNIFTARFEELGGQVVMSEAYIPGTTKDFTPMITKVKQADPDLFFVIAYYAETAQILIQTRELQFEKEIAMTSTCLKQETLNIAGEAAEGVFLMNCFSYDIPNERFQSVMAEYTAKTGKQPDAFVMQPYDVVEQLCAAIEEAGTTTDIPKIRDVLANMKDYEALAGKYSMNELGDAVRPLFPIKVEGGKFVNQLAK